MCQSQLKGYDFPDCCFLSNSSPFINPFPPASHCSVYVSLDQLCLLLKCGFSFVLGCNKLSTVCGRQTLMARLQMVHPHCFIDSHPVSVLRLQLRCIHGTVLTSVLQNMMSSFEALTNVFLCTFLYMAFDNLDQCHSLSRRIAGSQNAYY